MAFFECFRHFCREKCFPFCCFVNLDFLFSSISFFLAWFKIPSTSRVKLSADTKSPSWLYNMASSFCYDGIWKKWRYFCLEVLPSEILSPLWCCGVFCMCLQLWIILKNFFLVIKKEKISSLWTLEWWWCPIYLQQVDPYNAMCLLSTC